MGGNMNRQQMLKNIAQPEERLLFAKALDRADFSLKRHEKTFTDFLDAAKSGSFIERLQYLPEITVTAWGGAEDSERRMIGFAPDYMQIEKEDFPIVACKIEKNPRFGQSDLSHRDFLGSILGLGIDRSRVGDIFVRENGAVCFLHEEIAPFVFSQLKKVSKTPVNVTRCCPQEASAEREIQQKRMTVASLRLDAVAGAVFHLARGKVQDAIHGEKVFVNWAVVTDVSRQLKKGDMISLRGFGRFRLLETGAVNKKGRIAIEVGLYV